MGRQSVDKKVVVLADDLTGAADTGIQFLREGYQALLVPFDGIDSVAADDLDVLSVYTRSRSMESGQAAKQTGGVAHKLSSRHPALVYRKIDSCLRGNVVAELDAVMIAVRAGGCFLAPAFPEQGRTTIHGIHYLHGTPIGQTEMARDPMTPVKNSDLVHMFTRGSRFPAGRIDIDDFGCGHEYMRKKIERQFERGCRYIIFDAVDQSQLDQVAELGLSFFSNIFFSGSAGLATSVAGVLGRGTAGRNKSWARKERETSARRMLWLCGSASEKTTEQVKRLLESGTCSDFVLDAETLADLSLQKQQQLAASAAKSAENGPLVLHISAKSADAGRVLQGFVRISRSLISLQPPSCIFLSGGDTADAVLRATGVDSISLDKELISGVVLGRCLGGILDQTPVVTKAGSFGASDILLRVLQKLF